MINIQKAPYQGILLPDLGIGLDLGKSWAEHAIVSHAHADHIPKRSDLNCWATPVTTALMRARGFRGKVNELPFYEWVDLGKAQFQLLPAGHILGSAMVHIKIADGESLLYTGDYRFPAAPSSDGFQLPEKIDYFITEATFALPIYKWKSHDVLFEQIRREAFEALAEGITPIFLAYSLGKTQEILVALKDAALPVQVHGAAVELCKIYVENGVDLGNYEPYQREIAADKVLITPSSALAAGFASNVKKTRLIYVSGWATVEARRAQTGVDSLVPLSDHIDFFELLEVCKKLNPKKIWVTHTPDATVLNHFLGEMGFDAEFLEFERQEQDL